MNKLEKQILVLFFLLGFVLLFIVQHNRQFLKSEQNFDEKLMKIFRLEDKSKVDDIVKKDVEKMSEKEAMSFFYRVIALPQQGICRSLKRVGGKWPHPYIAVDGDKFVCMDNFQSNNDCLVYSFGIANDWTFEDFIVQFGCEVFAYDPSVKYPPARGQFIHFEQKGLADFYSSNMNTLLNYFKTNGHLGKTVQYLKIDIESHELECFVDWLASGALDNVKQIALELHLTKLHTGPKFKGLVTVLQDLYRLNFRLISYQVNLVARKVMDNYYTLMEVVFMKDDVWNYLD